jgi:hypothetical protein
MRGESSATLAGSSPLSFRPSRPLRRYVRSKNPLTGIILSYVRCPIAAHHELDCWLALQTAELGRCHPALGTGLSAVSGRLMRYLLRIIGLSALFLEHYGNRGWVVRVPRP